MAPHRSFLFLLLLVLLPSMSFFPLGTSDEQIGAMLPCLTTVFNNSKDDKKKRHKVGYHFHPNNDELINYYLKKKVQGIDLQQLHNAINEVDILNFEPQDLPAMSAIKSEDSCWYFFYRLEDGRKRKRGGGGNNRTLNSGKGKWKATGKTRTLRSDKTNQPIGTKKTLVFERPSDKTNAKDKAKDKDKVRAKSQTEWTIHEYHLPSDFRNPEKYVIVKLKKKGKKAVASSPEKGETSQSPEKAKETATSSTINDVESDNQSAIGFEIRVSENTLVEESSLSSCMDDTQSQANQVPICHYYDPNHNMDTEQGPFCQERSTSSCVIQVDSPSWANPEPFQNENTEQGPSWQEMSTSSCWVYNPSWTNMEPIPSYCYTNHIVHIEQGPSYPRTSPSSCVVDTPSWDELEPIREFNDPNHIAHTEHELSCREWSTPSCMVDNPPADLEASSGCHKPLHNVDPELSLHCRGFKLSNGCGVDNSIVQTPLTQADLEQNFDFISEDNEEDFAFKKLCEDLHIADSDGLHCSVDSTSSLQSPKFHGQNRQPKQGCYYIPQVTTVEP